MSSSQQPESRIYFSHFIEEKVRLREAKLPAQDVQLERDGAAVETKPYPAPGLSSLLLRSESEGPLRLFRAGIDKCEQISS